MVPTSTQPVQNARLFQPVKHHTEHTLSDIDNAYRPCTTAPTLHVPNVLHTLPTLTHTTTTDVHHSSASVNGHTPSHSTTSTQHTSFDTHPLFAFFLIQQRPSAPTSTTASSPTFSFQSSLSPTFEPRPSPYPSTRVAMGFGITAVCTAVGYTYIYTEYGFGLGDFAFTGIVNGGNCSLTLDTFTGDAGDIIDIYNVTSAGQMQLEDIHCNISSALGCNTNYEVYSGLPYQQINLEFTTLNVTGEYYAKNWTYFILPPVPSQPAEPVMLPGGTQVQFTTSQFSTEYGAALIGCLVAAGPTVWFPTNIPATLSSTPSQNNLPYTSSAVYAPTQFTNITVDLTSMNLSPSTVYDFWALCYNSNGQSAHSILFNQTTSASLPVPTAPASSSASPASTSSSSSSSSTGANSAASVLATSCLSASAVVVAGWSVLAILMSA